ncbi:MAG: response regulator [Lachnospiraceae bacterium]|nr:response regulator [Lachnospiraceae bacterium]
MKNVTVISRAETFTVKGLIKKLQELGVPTWFCSPDVEELEVKAVNTELFILITDENVEEMRRAIVFMKDQCIDSEKRLLLVGTKREKDYVMQYFPESQLHVWFDRPMVIPDIVEAARRYVDDEQIELRKRNILIVDDDTSYMLTIRDWLSERYRISMAASGLQAIQWLAKNKADLILLDYEMPVTPGPQVLEMLKSEVSTSGIPVMFLTGKGDKESIMKVLALKPADYLLKTIDQETLLRKLEDYFSKQKAMGN